ncbi:gliding motility-associated C-terminal domain-containing protein [Pedobacter mendelii]|uniref:MBG domain-containing protein n=1 Tax=Pedobacter mendelii TaxID=1908240 RepID=A0ABQ2BP26_9SPHI|nr:gliding motility-associated C-terminal domain-containing protein [Pedobacter mendelii]GGI29267.1 hypothetical protein GCM10008119_36780 [Pedobacter mendelii]
MKIYFSLLYILFSILFQYSFAQAQTNQTVLNGGQTNVINFGGSVCKYKWTNDTPGIGLAASGNGDIGSFVAVNNTSKPITATITATPESSGFAYIADTYLNVVSVINLLTNLVVATIPVGLNPHNVEISLDGSLVYVANYHGGSVSVINASTNMVKSNIITDDYQLGFIVSDDASTLYTISGNGKFSVINTSTNAIIKSLVLNITSYSMCFSADRKFIYIASNYGNDVVVFNTQTNAVEYTIPIGVNSNTLCLSPDGGSLYVSTRDNNIKIINTATRLVTSSIAISNPYATMLSSDGKFLYVTTGGNSVTVINTFDKSTVIRYPAGQYIEGISLNQDGSRLYIINQVPGNVQVVNTTNNTLAANINVGSNPYSIGHFVYSCAAKPITFTITVNPSTPIPKVLTSGVLESLNSIYGGVSIATNFTISGKDLTAPVVINAPEGFEISIDNNVFSSVLTIGSMGDLTDVKVYIRLKSTVPVGDYAGQILIGSSPEISMELAMPLSHVYPAPLLIIADNKTKVFEDDNPTFSATYSGFVNNDTPLKLFAQPVLTTIAVKSSPLGDYPILVSSAFSPNYTITYRNGTLSIVERPVLGAIPNGFSPNGDGINDFWIIKNLETNLRCAVSVFNRYGVKIFSSIGYKIPWDGTSKGKAVNPGTYYYVVNFNDGKKVSGSLTIIK